MTVGGEDDFSAVCAELAPDLNGGSYVGSAACGVSWSAICAEQGHESRLMSGILPPRTLTVCTFASRLAHHVSYPDAG